MKILLYARQNALYNAYSLPAFNWFEVLVFKGEREFSGLDSMVLKGAWYRRSESNRHPGTDLNA
jgi:hypothetical protein